MATAEDDGYDSDGCRFSCEPTEERRALERARRAWSSADDGTRAFWTKTRATWSQTTQCVEIAVSMPVDTRAEDISVDIQTTRLVVRVRWHGEVRALTGPLRRRCRADESVWTLSSSRGLPLQAVRDTAQKTRKTSNGCKCRITKLDCKRLAGRRPTIRAWTTPIARRLLDYSSTRARTAAGCVGQRCGRC